MTKAYLINGRIALDREDVADIATDIINQIQSEGNIVVIKGLFYGQYDEGIGRYIGDFTSQDGRQFMVYKDGAMEWYDFEPDEGEQEICCG
jgi:hypothetical protein